MDPQTLKRIYFGCTVLSTPGLPPAPPEGQKATPSDGWKHTVKSADGKTLLAEAFTLSEAIQAARQHQATKTAAQPQAAAPSADQGDDD